MFLVAFVFPQNKSQTFAMATAKMEDGDFRAEASTADNQEKNTHCKTNTAIVQKDDIPDYPFVALNTDCMLKIFGYLSMKDLLAVEKVCVHWKSVADLAWRRFTVFDCTRAFHRNLDRSVKLSLIRCGPHLKKICFPPLVNAPYSSRLLNIVARYCPNIESAVLHETRFQKSYTKNLTKVLRHLHTLEILDSDFHLNLDILKLLFERVPQLKVLTFEGYATKDSYILSRAFKYLPKSLTEFNFGNLCNVEVNFFKMLLNQCPNLEVLTMSVELRYDEIGCELAKFTKLRQIGLNICDMKIVSMEHLLSLTQLEKLVLASAQIMNDEFLEKISESLPLLRHLDIHAPLQRDVTDKGIKKLARLQHLEHLNLSYYNAITHKGIGAVADNGKLKELILISTTVTDSVISAVLKNCHDLKFLDLSACAEITSEAVQTLFEIFTPTNNRSKLKVILGGTAYEKSEWLRDVDRIDIEDQFATNLVIVSNTNNIESMLKHRYKRMFYGINVDYYDDSSSSEELDDWFNDCYEDMYDDYDAYSDYEYNLVDMSEMPDVIWTMSDPYYYFHDDVIKVPDFSDDDY